MEKVLSPGFSLPEQPKGQTAELLLIVPILMWSDLE
jgi:hypothetical protein